MILMNFLMGVISIYSLSFQTTKSEKIQFDRYAGKKILIVNVALNSPHVNQMQALQRLQNRYADSLVILAFPSNSFGNDVGNDNMSYARKATEWGLTYVIASKGAVKGPAIQPVYQWLSDSSLNGVTGQQVQGDFHKVLIDSKGQVTGVFSGRLDPEDAIIIDAINRSK